VCVCGGGGPVCVCWRGVRGAGGGEGGMIVGDAMSSGIRDTRFRVPRI
jgi:hypothetical protein